MKFRIKNLKFKIRSSRAFTVMEVIIASALFVMIAVSIAMLSITGMRMFGRGIGQANIQRRARVALDGISRYIRNAPTDIPGFPNNVSILNSYADQTVNNIQGNYIQITDTSGAPIRGYYLSSTGAINFVRSVAGDNPAIETDDKPIVDGASQIGVGNNIFSYNGNNMIVIRFNVTDQSIARGSQSADFVTSVFRRN